MQTTIYPGKITGKILGRPSKSHAQRAIVAAALSEGTSIFQNISKCDDVQNLIHLVKSLNVSIVQNDESLSIGGPLKPIKDELIIGESGLASRMMIPILSTFNNEFTINGFGTLLNRPFEVFNNVFQFSNVKFESHSGKLPVIVNGPLRSGNYEIDASIGSQFLTGWLYAFPMVEGETILHVKNLHSKPYIDLTIDVLKNFGISIVKESYSKYIIQGTQKYIPAKISIENDWSHAAFLLVAAAIKGEITIEELNPASKQGDKIILDILKKSGAIISVKNQQIHCISDQLRAFDFDATDYPDLFPPLVALAANCNGTSVIRGANRLVHKESHRAQALKSEYHKLNIEIELQNDQMIIHGGQIKAGNVDSFRDHRIAMSLAIAAINADNKVIINNFDCINKSYPEFLADIKTLGIKTA
jgi:3-phosphoshikimate 1-carboxyvinyltransferase